MLIRKTFKFEAAHRLLSASTERCRGIHGHSYKVEVFIDGELSEEDGMVLDFTLLKKSLGDHIDMFDHSLILWEKDSLVDKSTNYNLLTMLNPRWIVFPQHPTAEMMAAYFYFIAYERITSHKMRVEAVRVHETETGYAECRALDQKIVMANLWKETQFSSPCKGGKLF